MLHDRPPIDVERRNQNILDMVVTGSARILRSDLSMRRRPPLRRRQGRVLRGRSNRRRLGLRAGIRAAIWLLHRRLRRSGRFRHLRRRSRRRKRRERRSTDGGRGGEGACGLVLVALRPRNVRHSGRHGAEATRNWYVGVRISCLDYHRVRISIEYVCRRIVMPCASLEGRDACNVVCHSLSTLCSIHGLPGVIERRLIRVVRPLSRRISSSSGRLICSLRIVNRGRWEWTLKRGAPPDFFCGWTPETQ